MRFLPRQSVLCERGREWISLRLDGELSELAQKLLDAHLARCADCRAFEADVAATTRLVRTAPLEPLEQPLLLPHGRRLALSARRLSAVAASVATVALGLTAFLNLPSSGPLAAGPPVHVVASDNSDLQQLKQFRTAALVRPIALPQQPARGPQNN
jgi:predicted anti-sigma-YlaC factor YlaD